MGSCCDAEGHAGGEDRDFVDGVGVGEHGGAHGVTGLVVGDALLLLVGERHRLAALAHEHAVPGLLEVVHADLFRALAHGEESAASLTRFARSAPLMPGVPRPTTSRSTSLARRLCLTCTSRMRRRSSSSGSGTVTWRSKRPGRSRAESRMSGRLVAAIITMPSVASKPSISESIWLSVRSRSSCPPPRPVPLAPDESISSTKMIARPILRADWKRSRTRLAPTPTNISMKSLPVTDREGHAGLAGDRSGDERPAGPGGPTSNTPLGMRAPISPNLSGYAGSTTFLDLLDASRSRPRRRRWCRTLGAVGLASDCPMDMIPPIWLAGDGSSNR